MNERYHHGDLRAALLDAAEAVLDRDGIAGLTLRAAAREAGVSHAAPTHHFGDLGGLLSALAATGFVRFRTSIEAEVAAAPAEPQARLLALGRGYIGFARRHPGLFQLMFRSERLDWSSPGLAEAGGAAFALLTADEPEALRTGSGSFESLVVAMTRWSLVHGLATLLIDGRIAPMVDKVPGADIEVLVDQVVTRLVLGGGLGHAGTPSKAEPLRSKSNESGPGAAGPSRPGPSPGFPIAGPAAAPRSSRPRSRTRSRPG